MEKIYQQALTGPVKRFKPVQSSSDKGRMILNGEYLKYFYDKRWRVEFFKTMQPIKFEYFILESFQSAQSPDCALFTGMPKTPHLSR